MTMSQVNFTSKITMVEGLIDYGGFMFPMDFIDYLPSNVDHDYECNYGTYIETGVLRFTEPVENIEFPINRLEFHPDIEMVKMNFVDLPSDTEVSIYPVEYPGGIDIDLYPKIEVINGIAMVPEYGMWVVMFDTPGKATTTKGVNTNGNDVDVDVPRGKDTETGEVDEVYHLTVSTHPITANVKIKKVGNTDWITSSNNYFENIGEGKYIINVSQDGYITQEKQIQLKVGSNKITINLIKEIIDDGDIDDDIIVPITHKLPPLSYNEIYINNISDFKFIRIIPLVTVDNTSYSNYTSYYTNYIKSNNSQYNPDYVDFDIDTGKIIFKENPNSIWMIEAIPHNNINYYKSVVYIDLHKMDYRYIDIEINERENVYNLKCSISNPDDCDMFDSYSISYETADMVLDSGILATANINEEINTTVPSGSYTIIATLYNNSNNESVKIPITPENFSPHEDLDIQLKYNPHIKVTFKLEGLLPTTNNLFSIDLHENNATNLLESSIYEKYNIPYSGSTIHEDMHKLSNNSTIDMYIRPNNGILKFIFVQAQYGSYGNGIDNSRASYVVSLNNVTNGQIINISDYTISKIDRQLLWVPQSHNEIFKYTSFKYKNSNDIYHSSKFAVFNMNQLIYSLNITESNINQYIHDYEISDSKYIFNSSAVLSSVSEKYSYPSSNTILAHNVVQPIHSDNIRNVKIYTNIFDSDIIISDINSGSYRSTSQTHSFGGNSPIYRGTGTIDIDVLDNCVYSATIYRRGYVIKTFSFTVEGEDVIINKDLELLDEWEHNIPYSEKVINSTSTISFNKAEGSVVDVLSIEPLYPTMNIMDDKITGVPNDTSYRIRVLYNPPKSKVEYNPVELSIGNIAENRFHVYNKDIIIDIHENTGIDPIKSTIKVDQSNNPILTNKKIILYHNKHREVIQLNSLPKVVDIYGYSDDMYLELYDGDTLISKRTFFISDEYSDITIKVPNKQKTNIKIIPRNDIKGNVFIAWKEIDPFIAPYYGTDGLNEYTKYNKISKNTDTIIDNLYGNVGDRIYYKIFIDRHAPYEGSITISNNNIIDLNSISLPSKKEALRYYGMDTPNMEYASVRHRHSRGYVGLLYSASQDQEPYIYPYQNFQDGPIITTVTDRDYFIYSIKYNIPMFIENNNDCDFGEGWGLKICNTTTHTMIDGIGKLYHDGSRPIYSKYIGNASNAITNDALNGKYPFMSTIGGLLPRKMSSYSSHIPHYGIYRHQLDRYMGVYSYLYPGRYKYFHDTLYGDYSLGYNMNYIDDNGMDKHIYGVGDILIRKKLNKIDNPSLSNDNTRGNNDYIYILYATTNETERVRLANRPNYSGYWLYQVRDDNNINSMDNLKLEKIQGTNVLYTDELSIYAPSILNNGKDVILSYDVSRYINNPNKYATKFINKTVGSTTMKVKFNNVLDNTPNDKYLYNLDLRDTINLCLEDNNEYLHDISTRNYIPQITGGFPDIPLYYKLPTKDLVHIYGSYDNSEIIIDGNYYDARYISFESPIPYGISYNQSYLNKTIVSLDGVSSSDYVLVSGTFPMTINVRLILVGVASYYNPTRQPDRLIKGTITLNKSNLSVNEDGIYQYVYDYNDINITSTTVASDKYHTFFHDYDGRGLSGEYRVEIAEAGDFKNGTLDDWKSGSYNDINYLYITSEFNIVDFDQEYQVRIDHPESTGYAKLAEKYYNIRYIDKTTNLAYSLDKYYPINALWATKPVIENYFIGTLKRNLYVENKDVLTGPLKISQVSFTNTENVTNIRLLEYISGFTRSANLNISSQNRILYGIKMFSVEYSDNYKHIIVQYIDEPTVVISLDIAPELPSTSIITGSYIFTTNINFTERWDVVVSGEYSYNKSSSIVPIGEYTYIAKSYGYKPIHGVFTVNENATTYINLDFEKEDIPEYGTVSFSVYTPGNIYSADADVYIENQFGDYIKIRSSTMSIYLPFGSYSYIVKKDYYSDYTGVVDINSSHINVNVELEVKPTPIYTITFNFINPKHGVKTSIQINNDEEIEDVYEITAKENSSIYWSVSADGFEPDGGGFLLKGDRVINVNLSRGKGALYIDNIPGFMEFEIKVVDNNGNEYWRKPFMNYVYLDLNKDDYEYRIIHREYNQGEWIQGIRKYKERFGVLQHYNDITNFDASCELMYGILDITSVSNIPEYRLEIHEDIYPFTERPASLGKVELPVYRYRVWCIPEGNSANKYSRKDEVVYINNNEITPVSFIFGEENQIKYKLMIRIYPSSKPNDRYKVELYSNGSWTVLEHPSNLTEDSWYIPEKVADSTSRIRISRNNFKTQDITLTHNRQTWEQGSVEIQMVELMEGGYIYPLYKNDFNTHHQEESTSMLVSRINKNKDFYNNYRGMRFDGTRLGRLPATIYPRDYTVNPIFWFDKFHPIIMRFYPNSQPAGYFPMIINNDRRESFVISSTPTNTISSSNIFYRFELSGYDLSMPIWEFSNTLYTVKLFSINHQISSSGNTMYNTRHESSYILSHTNNKGMRLTTNNINQTIPHSVGVSIMRHDNINTFIAQTLPSTIYDHSKVTKNPIKVEATWRDNGFWSINLHAASSALNGDIYFFLENTGNVIAKQIGSPESKRWIKWTSGASWSDIMIDTNRLFYLLKHENSDYLSSIEVKYVYIEDGMEPYVGYMDLPVKQYPTQTYWIHPAESHVLTATTDIMQNSLLGFQRNKINNPVTVSFGTDLNYDSIELYTNYKIYNISSNGFNGDILESHPILNEDVTGLTLTFEKNTILSVEVTGIINDILLISLDKPHTDVNIYDFYKDSTELPAYNKNGIFNKPSNNIGNPVNIRFDISKFNHNNPTIPDRNLKLNEFDEIVVMGTTKCRHVGSTDEDYKYFIYRATPSNDNIMTFYMNPLVRDYVVTFRKRGYNTILQPLSISVPERNWDSTPINVALPTLHPVTE